MEYFRGRHHPALYNLITTQGVRLSRPHLKFLSGSYSTSVPILLYPSLTIRSSDDRFLQIVKRLLLHKWQNQNKVAEWKGEGKTVTVSQHERKNTLPCHNYTLLSVMAFIGLLNSKTSWGWAVSSSVQVGLAYQLNSDMLANILASFPS